MGIFNHPTLRISTSLSYLDWFVVIEEYAFVLFLFGGIFLNLKIIYIGDGYVHMNADP